MRLTLTTIGIFLSIALVATAAIFYWMAVQTKAGEHHLAVASVQQIQQLESQWSVEMARVRSDSFADFDSLTQFVPRMDRLKRTLAEAVRNTPSLPTRLVNNTNAYLSAITAKEERIERFKTGYAVLRNSVRYLPLAASNVMQQMQTRGANSAFIRNVATVTDEITTYLANPVPPERERLTRVLAELGNNIATRHPALINTAMNFVAHGQVLLEKQAPTEETFQAATSDQISDLGASIIKGLESEIEQTEALAAWYERGIIGAGVVLWVMWLTIAFKMPKGKEQTPHRGGTISLPQNPLLRRRQAGADEGLERLTADLMKTERLEETDPASAAELTAYRVGVGIAAERFVALAERINSSTEILNDQQTADAGGTPGEDREATAAVVESIHTQTNGIVELAKRLPTLGPKRDESQARLELNDALDDVADRIQSGSQALILKSLSPTPAVLAAESDVYLMLTNIMENAALAVQERGQKKGIIRVETRQEHDSAVVTITDNGVGIRPEQRKKVFQPFYTTREGALGMGLTVAQHLVEQYGGSMVMNSVPDQGTVVRVSLPARTRTAEASDSRGEQE